MSSSHKVAQVVKNPPANAGSIRDTGSISGWGRSPGGGHGNPLQCSCLENPMDLGAWQATGHRVAKSQTELKWQHSTHVYGRKAFLYFEAKSKWDFWYRGYLTWNGKRHTMPCSVGPTLCDPMDCSPPGSSVHGLSQAKYWSGLPCPPPGDLPDPGIDPRCPVSPVLTGGCFPSAPPEKAGKSLSSFLWGWPKCPFGF